jgi:hypothetical protein
MRKSFRCNSTFSYNRVSYSFLCPPQICMDFFNVYVLHCYTTIHFRVQVVYENLVRGSCRHSLNSSHLVSLWKVRCLLGQYVSQIQPRICQFIVCPNVAPHTFHQTLSPYSSRANMTPPCFVKGRYAFEYLSRNQAFGWSREIFEGFEE